MSGCFSVFWPLHTLACSYDIQKNSAPVALNEISFASVKQTLFLPRCVACHDGTPGKWDAGNFGDVKSRIDRIKARAVVRRDMPPGSPLSHLQLALISDWIAAGAPELGKAPVGDS